MSKKIIFRLTIEGKTPSTWELPQTNVMGIKEGKGKKFINLLNEIREESDIK